MTKKTMIKEYAEEFEDDFLDESPEDGMVSDMLDSFTEASNHQMMMAIELTKVVVSKNSDPNLSEEKIFDTFKNAAKVIFECSPLRAILEKL